MGGTQGSLVESAAPAPVVEYAAPAPVVEYFAPAPVAYAPPTTVFGGAMEKTLPAPPATTYLGEPTFTVPAAPAVFTAPPPTTAIEVMQGEPQYVVPAFAPCTTTTVRDPVVYTGAAVEQPPVVYAEPAPPV